MINIKKMENQIILGDSISLMRKMSENCVDMVFIDPPYNLRKKYSNYKDELTEKEYIAWCNEWLSECIRILKPSGSLFVINIPKWLIHHACHLNTLAVFRHWIAWDALGSPTNSKLLPAHYGILWYTKTSNSKTFIVRVPHQRDRKGDLLADWGGKKDLLHPYGKVASDIWNDIHRIRHKVRRNAHPCQLPPHLVERMILSTTDEGDIIFDPMVGTGTTAVAAKRMGRKYIGIDVDEKYVKIAKENVEASEPTMLGGKYVSLYLNKVITIRQKDYDAVAPHLISTEQRINKDKTKTMKLPLIKKA
ncbi:MAG: DNA-methyltransferase [Candidatus Micrarchaeales archaeon]